jgi:hypothetical protein
MGGFEGGVDGRGRLTNDSKSFFLEESLFEFFLKIYKIYNKFYQNSRRSQELFC